MIWYDVSHFEVPDTWYPDYDRYFADEDDLYYGYDDFDDEFTLYSDEHLSEVVDEYCGKDLDDVIDMYWKMGDPA